MSLGDVGREVDLSPATLLQRFKSKRGLLLALSQAGATGIRDAFGAARAQSSTPLAALHEALRLLTEPVASPEALSHNLAFLQIDLTDDEFHEQALARADALVEDVWVLLEEAVGQGQLIATDTSRLSEAGTSHTTERSSRGPSAATEHWRTPCGRPSISFCGRTFAARMLPDEGGSVR
jgi:AcrR family transcriptional regulator